MAKAAKCALECYNHGDSGHALCTTLLLLTANAFAANFLLK